MSRSSRSVLGGFVFVALWFPVSGGATDQTGPKNPWTTITIDSKILDEQRTLVVTLPQGYEDERTEYPVLYHLDANTVNGRPLPAGGRSWPEMITVGIVNTDRSRDMFPVYVGPKRPTSGGAEAFLRFLTTEVIPLVDDRYRTSGQRILYGMSNSGLFTVYALLKRPQTFAGYIASSPMIGHCPEYMWDLAREFVGTEGPIDSFLYIIYGNDDSTKVVDGVPPLIELLESNPRPGFRLELTVIEGGGHVPPESLGNGLTAFYASQTR